MKKLLSLIVVACVVSCSQPPVPAAISAPRPAANVQEAVPPPKAPSVIVHFSPRGGCTDSIVSFIKSAKKTVRLQAYGFTSTPVADALCEAAKSGASVEVVLDRSNDTDKYSQMKKVKTCGVRAWIDAKHQIAHNKVIVVDSYAVETGSFNYTNNAEAGNAENCLIVTDADLASQYEANWELHRAHSESR